MTAAAFFVYTSIGYVKKTPTGSDAMEARRLKFPAAWREAVFPN
jgi:hypothetical protein